MFLCVCGFCEGQEDDTLAHTQAADSGLPFMSNLCQGLFGCVFVCVSLYIRRHRCRLREGDGACITGCSMVRLPSVYSIHLSNHLFSFSPHVSLFVVPYFLVSHVHLCQYTHTHTHTTLPTALPPPVGAAAAALTTSPQTAASTNNNSNNKTKEKKEKEKTQRWSTLAGAKVMTHTHTHTHTHTDKDG